LKPEGWFKQNLSEEQFEEFQAKIKAMREQGIPPQEMRQNVQKLLEEYGIDPSQQRPPHPGRHQLHGWLRNNLNEEQRQKVQDKLEELHEQDASREEVHAAIKTLVAEFGLELPEPGPGDRALFENLTPQQRQEMRQKRHELFQSGGTPEEVHQEMQKLLDQYSRLNNPNPEGNIEQEPEVEEDGLAIRNYPNPFNPVTTFEYKLTEPARISLKIYNISGQLIRDLVSTYKQTGTYTVHWDGHSNNGQQVPSGVYFIQLTAGEESRSERIVLMK
jgi:DNA-binding transcriptional MerR regulator